MKNFTLLIFLMLSAFMTFSQNVITVGDDDLTTTDVHWTSDNIYLLDGFVYLEGGTLTIDPGTVIKGKATPTTGDNASALIITRDAKIMAEGTEEMPIIFTAEDDDIADTEDLTHEDRGLWGGVVLLGYGVIGDETTEASIEGIPAGETRAVYGGNDDTHNAGVLRYVSIRHGGAELAPGDEINGLSVAGIGSQTVLDHIEVFSNSDDGYEFWGGTVNAKYLVAAFCGDDAFDWDDGWRGNAQFWFAIQAPDEAGSAGEHDGAHPDDNSRFSKPNIYNVTYIGPGSDASNDDVAIMLRDGTGGTYANSIFTGFPTKAIEVEDRAADVGTDARKHMEDGDLVIKNNIWWDFAPGDEFTAAELIQVTEDAEDPSAAFLASHMTTNMNSIEDPMLRGISREPNGQLDPRFGGGSPVGKDVAPIPEDVFFTDASYKGAFGTKNWAMDWTALDAMGYFGDLPYGGSNEVLVSDDDIDETNDTTHWTADNVYLLDGFVYVENGVLWIDPGTVIKGLATPSTGDNASALIITRDAKIIAEGTEDLPIIFTAEDDDLADQMDLTHEDRGLWGGVVLLGYGVIGDETTEASIEGIPAGESRAVYGGNDDTHNAGILKYVSIRHGGAELAPGDEINGLSVAGIGSETVLDHIEVFSNSDDGYEFWGGTVRANYLIAAFCGDDAFDYDDGWRGGGQFWFAIQAADEAGSAGEHDGAHPDDNPRFAQPTISNVTYIGPGMDATNDDVALMLRDGAGGYYLNSIFTDFPTKAIEVEDRAADVGTDARKHMEDGDLIFKSNIWWDFAPGDEFTAAELIQVTEDAEDPTAAFLTSHMTNNMNTVEDPMLRGISREPNGQLDPRLGAGSPAWGGVSDELKSAAEIYPDLEKVTYRGAFGSNNWATSWSALDQMGYFGDLDFSAGGNEILVTDDDLTGTTTWTADNTYFLDGFVYLEQGMLTIQPGTVIKGKATPSTGDNASALIITRDAKIMAEGTEELPIIFTAEDDDVTDPADLTHEDRGLWGGVVLLGYGVIGDETEEASIEGIPAGETRAVYGGQDDTHNAGMLKYVSIRHGGAELAPGDEINGLSVAGIGSETVLDHIEVFSNSDDGYEFWGGTVRANYLVSAFCGDDAFDYDDGWRGGGQFWFAIQAADEAGSAGEHDGAHPDDNERFAKPVITNVTYIGPGMDATNDDVALMLRDGAGGMYANSIFTDFPTKAIEVEDRAADVGTDARKHMEDGDLVFRNNIWWDFAPGDEFTAAELIQVTEDAEDPSAAFLTTHMTSNMNTVEDPMIAGISREPNQGLDPRPNPGSPAWSNVADVTAEADGILTTDYRGAFGHTNWATVWTALDMMGYFGNLYTDVEDLSFDNGFRLGQNYPNPSNGYTTIEYTIPADVHVSLEVFDITGRKMKTLVSENQMKGTYKVELSGLKTGIYFYQMVAGENKATHKMIIQ